MLASTSLEVNNKIQQEKEGEEISFEMLNQ
jgi:hypothetical protein